jgi:hypothetical protein
LITEIPKWFLVDHPCLITPNQESIGRIAERTSCYFQFSVRSSHRPRNVFGRAKEVALHESLCGVALNIGDLSIAQTFKSTMVTVDNAERMADFIQPEFKIGEVARELVRVEACEPYELSG